MVPDTQQFFLVGGRYDYAKSTAPVAPGNNGSSRGLGRVVPAAIGQRR